MSQLWESMNHWLNGLKIQRLCLHQILHKNLLECNNHFCSSLFASDVFLMSRLVSNNTFSWAWMLSFFCSSMSRARFKSSNCLSKAKYSKHSVMKDSGTLKQKIEQQSIPTSSSDSSWLPSSSAIDSSPFPIFSGVSSKEKLNFN